MTFRRQHTYGSRATVEAGTPLRSEYVHDTTLNTVRVGDGATLGGWLLGKWGRKFTVTPAQITSNQNDYNPTDLAIAERLLINSSANVSLSGLAGGATDRTIVITNKGSFKITLSDASASSTAANRFSFGTDIILNPKGSIELEYDAAASLWLRSNGGQKLSTISEELLLTGAITPSQIGANQNDYAPANVTLASTLRLSSDASRNITGIIDPRDGAIKVIVNVGTNPIVLKNADAGSTAANRFDFGSDVTLAGKQSATLRYDATDARWKLLSATAGAAVAAGAVTAQTLSGSALGASMINGTLVASVASGALTVAIKTLAGVDPSAADPVYVLFRSATAANGGYSVVTLTAATSFVVSSGSSLGVPGNNLSFRIWLVAINDAGTFRLGVINCLNGTNIYPLQGFGINAACTVEGGAGGADSASTMYFSAFSGTPAPYVVLGYMTWEGGLPASGTWSAVPTRIQIFGSGVALPGSVVARARLATGAVATGSTIIPVDDTIPQITEGDQYMSMSFTPSSGANIGRIASQVAASYTGGSVFVVAAALFQDSIANALAAVQHTGSGASAPLTLRLDCDVLFNTVAAIIYRIRMGSQSAVTNTFNGATSARLLGGVLNSWLLVEEIMT